MDHILYSTEIYDSDSNSFSPGPELPYGLFRHCLVKINDTLFAFLGGRVFTGTSYQPTKLAFFYNSGEKKDLKPKRDRSKQSSFKISPFSVHSEFF